MIREILRSATNYVRQIDITIKNRYNHFVQLRRDRGLRIDA
jgi:hypothetical protein